jgi:hypothetical protein
MHRSVTETRPATHDLARMSTDRSALASNSRY